MSETAVAEDIQDEAVEAPGRDPAEELKALLEKKCADEKTRCEVVRAEGNFEPTDPIPGLKMSFAAATAYEVEWRMVQVLLELKRRAFQATLVPTAVGLHVVRGFNRIEWTDLQMQIAKEAERRVKFHQEQKTPEAFVGRDLQSRGEEMIALRGTVLPDDYDERSLRRQPAGIASQLAAAIMGASSLDEQQELPPIRL